MKTFKTILACIATVLLLLISINTSQACTFKASFSGDTTLCAGTSINYLSKLTSGHHYRWVVTGGILVSGKSTDSIIVYWATPGTGTVELIDSTLSCKDSLTKIIQIGLTSAVLTAAPYNAEGGTTVSGKLYTLTQYSTAHEYSAAWNQYQINLNRNFDFTFITNQSNSATPAEGMVFVLQNTGNNASPSTTQDDDMGYYEAGTGDMDQSIGVEEDIYQSSGFADSSSSHLNLVINKNYQPIRPQVNISPALSNSSNRKLRVTWNRDANLFEIYFDGIKEFSWSNDIVKNVFKGNPNVWFGFTGATGAVTSSKMGSTNYTATQSIKTDTLIYNQPIITATKDTLCAGDTAILTSTSGLLYNWSNGATTKSIKVFNSGTYTVSVTDSSNCTTSATQTIVVMPKITASFTASNGCLGKNVAISNNTTPTTGVKYSWKFGNGDSVSGGTPIYSYKSTGKYTISLSATNGGCSRNASNPITVYARPVGVAVSKSLPFEGQLNTGDVINPDIVCLGDTNTYQFSSPTGYSNSDYGSKWIISGKTFATASGTINTDTVFKSPISSKNAYFQFFPGRKFADSVLILTMHIQLLPGNCDTVITRYIQARPKAISKFVFANACQGIALSFIDTSTIATGDAVNNWNWTFGDGATSQLQNPEHAYAKPGTYSVTLSATSNAGCGIPVTQSVTQYPGPVAGFHAVAGCQQAGSAFTDSSTISSGTITKHAWDFGDGSTSALSSPSYVYPKSGPYEVKLVVTSSFGCKDSITKAIRVEPAPIAAFSYNNACVGTPIYFANKSTDSTTGTKYQWNFGDNGTSTSSQPSHTYAANGTYSAKLTATTKYGCIDTIVVKVTPYAETVPDIVYSGACTKNAVAFGDSDKNDAGATYSWTFGDGASDVAVNDTDSHVYGKAGTFKVSLTIQNGDGCVDTESKSITIVSFPVASFSASNICVGKSLTFNNTTTGSGLTYLWNFGDSTSGKLNVSTLLNPSHTYDTAGIYTVVLSVTNTAGCTDTFSQTTNAVAPPIVAPWSYKIHNQTVSFTPKDTTQKTYKWYFGTGDSSSTKKPAYTFQSKGKYDVKLVETNTTGCSASYSDSITLTGAGVETVYGPKNNLNISIFPNPFESKTSISYTLRDDSRVNVSVYDIQGKLVAELKDGNFGAGKYQDEFDAVKYNATDGVYLVKMTVNGEVFTGRIVEMR